ncbi:MAG: fibronectin type III domain-containing protein [Opitutaceae bacterium]
MNRSKHFLTGLALGVSLALSITATAAISLSLDAEKLESGTGGAMPTSGLLLLVVSTEDDTFSLPTADEFVAGSSDDVILATWDLSDGGGVPGVFSGLASNLAYEVGFDAGDPLMLYWFPASTKSSTGPGAGASYGLFRDGDGIMTGSVWELPADGTLLYSLKFFTENATEVADGGHLPAYAGSAALPLGVALSPVTPPTGLSVENEPDAGVRVIWTDTANNEAGYLVERSVAGSGIWVMVGSVGANGTSFVDGSVAEKTNYQYRIRAVNTLAQSTEVVSSSLLSSFGRVANISTRGNVQSGASILIGGFVVEGSQSKRVLIRAVGPKLGEVAGLAGVLEDATLELYRTDDAPGTLPFESNDDWEENANSAEIVTVTADLGAFAFNPGGKDAALLVTLPPGGYTAKVKGVGGKTGLGLVEIYDADEAAAPADVVNISTRGRIGTAAEILIAGFVIDGDRSKTVLVRGIGPRLADFGVTGTVTDPFLRIQRNLGAAGIEEMATNDNWSDAPNAGDIPGASEVVGGFQLAPGSKDSAILITLPPGIYTAKLSGVGGAVGNGLIEVYRVP